MLAYICMRDAISIYARVEILKQFTVPICIEKKCNGSFLCIDHPLLILPLQFFKSTKYLLLIFGIVSLAEFISYLVHAACQ